MLLMTIKPVQGESVCFTMMVKPVWSVSDRFEFPQTGVMQMPLQPGLSFPQTGLICPQTGLMQLMAIKVVLHIPNYVHLQ